MTNLTINKQIEQIKNQIEKCYTNVAKHFNIPINKELLSGLVVCSDLSDFSTQNSSCQKYSYHNEFCIGNHFKVMLKSFSTPKYIIEDVISEIIPSIITEDFDTEKLSIVHFDETINKIIHKAKETIKERINTLLCNDVDLLIELSNSTYEKSNCKGHIIINRDKSNLLLNISSSDTKRNIKFIKEHKKIIRKLLEIATDNIALHVNHINDEYIIDGFTNLDDSLGIHVCIIGPQHIKIYEKYTENNSPTEKLIAEYFNNNYYYTQKSKILETDKEKIIKFFSNDNDKALHIEKYVKNIIDQSQSYHGALIVFSDDYIDEKSFIKRMSKNSRAITPTNEPINLFNAYKEPKSQMIDLLVKLCNIDGAIVFKRNGDLVLFGTILDGLSLTAGKIDRGSRYNSAQTFVDYYKNENKQSLVIVMSEDGPIDVLS